MPRRIPIVDYSAPQKRKPIKVFDDLPDILNTEEAADYLGVCNETILRKCKSGEIKSLKVGNVMRIRKERLFEYIIRLEEGA